MISAPAAFINIVPEVLELLTEKMVSFLERAVFTKNEPDSMIAIAVLGLAFPAACATAIKAFKAFSTAFQALSRIGLNPFVPVAIFVWAVTNAASKAK